VGQALDVTGVMSGSGEKPPLGLWLVNVLNQTVATARTGGDI